jgi:hypothetical protein
MRGAPLVRPLPFLLPVTNLLRLHRFDKNTRFGLKRVAAVEKWIQSF